MNAYMKSRGLRSLQELAANKPHGTRTRYLAGCKCVDCRKANSLYSYEREVEVREGRGNPVISAARARNRILALGRQGVGYKTVAKVSGVPKTVVYGIRQGTRLNARRTTVELILAVKPDHKAARVLVPAARLWRLISQLLKEGFTKAELARRLGYKTRALQFDEHRVTVRNERDVIALHRQLIT